ncbi:hypothetical protein JR316_0012495 [Psilocybe cubensis]|uniref:Uncharacterized protein n=1 Tax=Psilocybe cubensis TaxID=181762 RepID=A0ACB8GJZ2_PSICU|nr:hypothetical protein JR316_0012495 [Psilocybe cubensis]KAH9475384.1 hypothetical protein JR316_0012495 [Psilocybe cubensis]
MRNAERREERDVMGASKEAAADTMENLKERDTIGVNKKAEANTHSIEKRQERDSISANQEVVANICSTEKQEERDAIGGNKDTSVNMCNMETRENRLSSETRDEMGADKEAVTDTGNTAKRDEVVADKKAVGAFNGKKANTTGTDITGQDIKMTGDAYTSKKEDTVKTALYTILDT